MRIVVFGAKGQLGRDLIRVLASEHSVAGFDLPEADICEPGAALGILRDTGADCVVNAAAYTDVEKAEDDPETAFRVNESGAGLVARAAAEVGAPVVYYSTDFVFDGSARTPYQPEDPPNPLSVYGQSKLAGELATRMANDNHYILRTAWLYGPGGNHFVEKILAAAARRPSLRVVDDETGSPTHTWDLARATRALIGTGRFGTYHAVNRGHCTRRVFAEEILRLAGKTTPVEPCSASEYPVKAPRPAFGALDPASLEAATGAPMRTWQEALAHYFEREAPATG
jgi:dTDP-4-dehydrorhamnose reductase